LDPFKVHKVLMLTAKKHDQRDYKNSNKNRLVKIKVIKVSGSYLYVCLIILLFEQQK